MIKIKELNSLISRDLFGAITRETKVPMDKRIDLYEKNFDSTTVFYDILFFESKVLLLGPPLRNFLDLLRKTSIFIDNKLVDSNSIIWDETNDRSCTTIINMKSEKLPKKIKFEYNGKIFESRITNSKKSDYSKYSKVVVTKNFNNKIEWIIDWINYYEKFHDCDTFVIYDNGSTDYSLIELKRQLEILSKKNTIIIYHTPFKFGSTPFRYNQDYDYPWEDFFQYIILDHCKFIYWKCVNFIINVDIDELIVTDVKKINKYLEKCSHIDFKGIFTYSTKLKNEYSFEDFDRLITDSKILYKKEGLPYSEMPTKWILNTESLDPFKIKLCVHNIFSINNFLKKYIPNSDFKFYHYRSLSVKSVKNRNTRFNKDEYFTDKKLNEISDFFCKN